MEALPADPQKPNALKHKYEGLHAALNRKYMLVIVWSHPNLGYIVSYMAHYTPVSNRITFDCLRRIMRYLSYYPHRPSMYPQMPQYGLHVICSNYDSVHFGEHKITNASVVFDDGDGGDNQRTQ